MRANRSFGAKWNEDESQHLEFKKLPQTSENQTPSWLLLQTSITKQKYQVANFNLQPTKVPKRSLYWPMPWHVKEPCGGMSRRVNRAKNIPWTLNPQPTQPPTNSTNDPHLFYGQHLPHKSQTQWVPGKVKLFIQGSFNNPLRIASLKGFIFWINGNVWDKYLL